MTTLSSLTLRLPFSELRKLYKLFFFPSPQRFLVRPGPRKGHAIDPAHVLPFPMSPFVALVSAQLEESSGYTISRDASVFLGRDPFFLGSTWSLSPDLPVSSLSLDVPLKTQNPFVLVAANCFLASQNEIRTRFLIKENPSIQLRRFFFSRSPSFKSLSIRRPLVSVRRRHL